LILTHSVLGNENDDLEVVQALLSRSATAVLFLSGQKPSPWAVPSLRNELEQRAAAHAIRLITVLLPGSAEADAVPLSTVVDYREKVEDERRVFEAAIVGYRQPALSYAPLPDVPADAQADCSLSGAFLPVAESEFESRPELNNLRTFWRDESQDGVLALIGIGGSGKTALLTRFLQELPGNSLSDPSLTAQSGLLPASSVFLWSIYDNPNIEYFIRGLYDHLTGEKTLDPARDVVYRLIRFLEDNAPPGLLIVLDGLELVQEGEASPGGFGLVRDSSLRHLIRRVAQGDLPVKLILTSRYALPDLEPFAGSGYRTLQIDRLDSTVARQYLRARGITGTDSELDDLLRAYGNHLLTLDLLVRALKEHLGSNLRSALDLPSVSMPNADTQAQRLARVLAFIASNLPTNERIVLQVLSVLRKPVAYAVLADFFNTKGSVAPLVDYPKLSDPQLRILLSSLQRRGLIAFYGMDSEMVCTIHPAIRDYFSATLGEKEAEVQAKLSNAVLSLIDHPSSAHNAINPKMLDIYEQVMYHAVASGVPDLPLDQYPTGLTSTSTLYERLGSYQHFAWRVGDYQRGLRITALMMNMPSMKELLSWRTTPVYDHTLFLLDSGQVAQAEQHVKAILDRVRTLKTVDEKQPGEWQAYADPLFIHLLKERYGMYEGMLIQTLCDALVIQGKLLEAKVLMDDALGIQRDWHVTGSPQEGHTGSNPYGRRALVLALLGEVQGALQECQAADQFAKEHSRNMLAYLLRALEKSWTPDFYHKVLHAVILTRLGKLRAARAKLEQIDFEQMKTYRPLTTAQYNLAAAEIAYRGGDDPSAERYAQAALGWAMQVGHQHIYTQALIMQARLLLPSHERARTDAVLQEAEDVARKCGFSLQLVDCLVVAGYEALQAEDVVHAEAVANEALTISEERSYRWGIGDAAYLLAKCAQQRKQYALAMHYAQQALDVRQTIQDPRQHYAQTLIAEISLHIL
ncbi:MAG TPA: hypothetical protein VKQ72_08460, partial [Aggregatilineales bacterium]|nr:hypothetical protein [Aggregatilineales bacterium]